LRRAIRAQQPPDGLAATHRRRGPLSRARAPRLARFLQSMLIGLKATLSASTSPRRPCRGMLATSASQCRTACRCTLWQSINPNGETWRITQAQITAYIKTAIALAHAAGGFVMLAGDWNAVQQTPWTLANVSAQRATRGSIQRDAGRAQSGRPKRSAGRPARLADGAEVSSDDELGVSLLTGAAV